MRESVPKRVYSQQIAEKHTDNGHQRSHGKTEPNLETMWSKTVTGQKRTCGPRASKSQNRVEDHHKNASRRIKCRMRLEKPNETEYRSVTADEHNRSAPSKETPPCAQNGQTKCVHQSEWTVGKQQVARIENRDPLRAPSDDATFLPRRKRVQCPVPPPGYQKRGLSRGQRVNRSEETVQWREGRTRRPSHGQRR